MFDPVPLEWAENQNGLPIVIHKIVAALLLHPSYGTTQKHFSTLRLNVSHKEFSGLGFDGFCLVRQ